MKPWPLFAILLVTLAAACSSATGPGKPRAASSSSENVNLADVDTAALTAREKAEWSGLVSELLAPCPDQPVSIAECVLQKRACSACVPAARFLAVQVERGKTRSQIEAAFRLRFAADTVQKIEVSGSPSKGAPSAPVMIVEWADFECPFCGHAAPVLDEVLEKHRAQVKIVFKHYPLSAHKHAEKAARAAIAAERQGKFWEMHRELFANQENLEPAALVRLAQKIGLDVARFETDMASDPVSQVLERDRRQADALGLRSTPLIFINGRHFDLEHFKLAEDLQPWISIEIAIQQGSRP